MARRPTPPPVLDLDAAAKYLGLTPAELMRSFHRGLPPGRLALKTPDGLRWRRADLLPPKPKTIAQDPDAAADRVAEVIRRLAE
jgi:hypothetical protein